MQYLIGPMAIIGQILSLVYHIVVFTACLVIIKRFGK